MKVISHWAKFDESQACAWDSSGIKRAWSLFLEHYNLCWLGSDVLPHNQKCPACEGQRGRPGRSLSPVGILRQTSVTSLHSHGNLEGWESLAPLFGDCFVWRFCFWLLLLFLILTHWGYVYWFLKRFYLFIFREEKGWREGEKHQWVVASQAPPTGDLAHNPGMCPDSESNQQPSGLQVGA